MTVHSLIFTTLDETIRAATDANLASSETQLLATLLSQEDQHNYNHIINSQLSHHIYSILHQLSTLLHLDSSITWMTIHLLKQLTTLQHHIDLLTIVASLTLSAKYQHSQTHSIDYDLIAQCCHIDSIQLIHDTELDLLDIFSYDISVPTPDHFFSYLSNLVHDDDDDDDDDDDVTLKQIIEQARSTLSHQTLELLHNYPSSIVALSLISTITSNTFFIYDQIKSFLLHKKDPTHYSMQLLQCMSQFQRSTV